VTCCGSNCPRCPFPHERRLLWLDAKLHARLEERARREGLTVDQLAERVFADVDGGKL
jgi:hypothetical protein